MTAQCEWWLEDQKVCTWCKDTTGYSPSCWCARCHGDYVDELRKQGVREMTLVFGIGNHYIVCPDCGNKRCPKATHHDNACTKSNEYGQEGSRYGGVPLTPEQEANQKVLEAELDEIRAARKPKGDTDES